MPKVVDLSDRPPLTDIPECLRHLAKQIERGDFHPTTIVVVLGTRVVTDPKEDVKVFGFGDIGRSEEALGWLVRGLQSGI